MHAPRRLAVLVLALSLPAAALATSLEEQGARVVSAPELHQVHELEAAPTPDLSEALAQLVSDDAATQEEVAGAVAAVHADSPLLTESPAPLPSPLEPDVSALEPAIQDFLTGLGSGNVLLAAIAGIIVAVFLARRFIPALSSGPAAVGIALALGVATALLPAARAGAPLTLALVLAGLVKAGLSMAGFDTLKAAGRAGSAAVASLRTRADVARTLGGGPQA